MAAADPIKADFLEWLSGDGQRDVAVADAYLYDTNADRDVSDSSALSVHSIDCSGSRST